MQVYVILRNWVQATNQIYKNSLVSNIWIFLINHFRATCLFLYPLKASQNQTFSNDFRGYRKRPAAWNELPFKPQPHKMVNTLKQFVENLPTNSLSVFYHFVGLALKGLILTFFRKKNV